MRREFSAQAIAAAATLDVNAKDGKPLYGPALSDEAATLIHTLAKQHKLLRDGKLDTDVYGGVLRQRLNVALDTECVEVFYKMVQEYLSRELSAKTITELGYMQRNNVKNIAEVYLGKQVVTFPEGTEFVVPETAIA